MAASAVVVAGLVWLLMSNRPTISSNSSESPTAGSANQQEKTLTLYYAAGLQAPVNEITTAYEASHHVHVETEVGGSGTLLSQILVSGGDVFLAADRFYLDEASQKNLAPLIVPVAYQFPVIVVHKGNPKRISALKDLLKPQVRVSLADPQRAAIGRAVGDLLEKDDRWEPLWKKAVTHTATVNEVATNVKLGGADAGIVWNTTAAQVPDLEVVRVPEFDSAKSEIAAGLLKSSKDPQAAQEFLRYLTNPDEGLKVFARHGYEVAVTKAPVPR